jgi:hypothetical protein
LRLRTDVGGFLIGRIDSLAVDGERRDLKILTGINIEILKRPKLLLKNSDFFKQEL